MAKKIGEILIEKGLLTQAQLEAALRNQLILGGHIGTCLLELGFVDEEQFARTLAEALDFPYASTEKLRGSPVAARRLLSKALVEEHQVVPIDLQGQTLHVAMVDPKNLLLVDALAFASSCKIVPWVAPEVRIVEAMELLYDIPRRHRYIAIAQASRRSPMSGEGTSEVPPSPHGEEIYLSGTATEPSGDSSGAEFGYGRSWLEIAEELCGTAPDGTDSAENAAEPAAPAIEPLADSILLVQLSERLCRADDKEEIAAAALQWASRTAARVLLLAVKGSEARVWAASGFPAGVTAVESPRFEILRGGIFDLLLGNPYYRGPLPREPRYLRLYETLGTESPSEVFLAPVHLHDRLVALFLADGGAAGRVEGGALEYLRLARMLALSLNALLLKKKVREIASVAGMGPRRIVPPGHAEHDPTRRVPATTPDEACPPEVSSRQP